MKELNLLVWLAQLGLNVAIPLAGFVLLGIWLNKQFALGNWVVYLGCAVGILCAIDGLRTALRIMEHLAGKKNAKDKTYISFNDHE